jgi:hypothetical protein
MSGEILIQRNGHGRLEKKESGNTSDCALVFDILDT